jgi:hypothetical protein
MTVGFHNTLKNNNMHWIDKLNQELEERRNRNKTEEGKEESKNRLQSWIGTQGGESSIDILLNWQKQNNHNIGEIAKLKDDKWKQKIGDGNKNKIRSEELKKQLSQSVIEYNNKLSSEQKSKKYSNDSSSRKSLKIRTEVLNMIPTDIFNTSDAKIACEKYGLGNWKAFLRDERIIKVIRKGTNQSNPGIYQKLKYND